MSDSLLDMIIKTQNFSNPNNVIKFNDNSRFVILLVFKRKFAKLVNLICILYLSAICGFKVKQIKPKKSTEPSSYILYFPKLNLVFTAETHNFPTGVEPFRYFISIVSNEN